ncbi:MAG: anthranilate synthase component I family protein [Salibacteraceae bacterium]
MGKLRTSIEFKLSNDIQIQNLDNIEPVYYLKSNSTNQTNLLALGSIKKLEAPTFDSLGNLLNDYKDWAFGYLTFDAKNQLEKLTSENPKTHSVAPVEFHIPSVVFEWKARKGVAYFYSNLISEEAVLKTLTKLQQPINEVKKQTVHFTPRITKEEYLEKIRVLKDEIQYGNIYEANFCQEFLSNDTIDPYLTFEHLTKISPTPFSCFVKNNDFYLMCASPERYLKNTGGHLVSEPIKGTIKRHVDPIIDQQLKQDLLNSQKDRNENVMIVDLVRNDLSICAKKASVKVEELFGIYSFPQVHQMISKVSATLNDNLKPIDAIRSSFPMGSMTGTPKIMAMKLIEKHEAFQRGIYSGTVGYFRPNGDFDFNVVIRSLLYSSNVPALSFAVGGAITDGSDPETEYEESLLKAKAIFELFK